MTDSGLQLEGIGKHYGQIAALTDFSLRIEPGDVVGLIGPNGAGKSTLFNVISGFVKTETGTAQFGGRNLSGLVPSTIASLGVRRTFQSVRTIGLATLIDNLILSISTPDQESLRNILFHPVRTLKRSVDHRRFALDLIDRVNLLSLADRFVEDLSYGQQKMLMLMCCLAVPAKLLLLDEPLAGLDPGMRKTAMDELTQVRETDTSIIIIEHDLTSALEMCDRLVVVCKGKKLAEGLPKDVLKIPEVRSLLLG